MNATAEPENILLEQARALTQSEVIDLTNEEQLELQAKRVQTTNRINAFKKHVEQGKSEKHSWYLAFQEYPKF
jgi:cytochrome c